MAALVALLLVWIGPTPFLQAEPEVSSLQALLPRLVGEWHDDSGRVFTVVETAGGRGLHSTWKTPGGYEAVALWAYDAETRRLKVFEVNSEGQVLLHVGHAGTPDTLVLDRYSKTNPSERVQHSTMSWRDGNLVFHFVYEKEGVPTGTVEAILERVDSR